MHNGEGYERLCLVRVKNTVHLSKTEVQGKKSQGLGLSVPIRRVNDSLTIASSTIICFVTISMKINLIFK